MANLSAMNTMTARYSTTPLGYANAAEMTPAEWDRRARLQKVLYRAGQLASQLAARESRTARTAEGGRREAAGVLRHLAARKATIARRAERVATELAPMADVRW